MQLSENGVKSTTPQFMYYHPQTIGGGGITFLGRQAVRPLSFFPFTLISRDAISVRSGGISMKFATNIHHTSGHCRKAFQGQRSKVKVVCVQRFKR